MTAYSDHGPNSVTFNRKSRSRCFGILGHVQSEFAVTLVQNPRSRSIGIRGHIGPEYAKRTQRRSDGTVSLEGVRFEVPQVFAHLRELTLRYARWDCSQADIIDLRSGVIQASIYPLDKTGHAHGHRRPIAKPTGLSSQPLAKLKGPAKTEAPLMRHLLAQFAATGLPPAFIEHDDSPLPCEPNP